jgi:hypothetical protein
MPGQVGLIRNLNGGLHWQVRRLGDSPGLQVGPRTGPASSVGCARQGQARPPTTRLCTIPAHFQFRALTRGSLRKPGPPPRPLTAGTCRASMGGTRLPESRTTRRRRGAATRPRRGGAQRRSSASPPSCPCPQRGLHWQTGRVTVSGTGTSGRPGPGPLSGAH